MPTAVARRSGPDKSGAGSRQNNKRARSSRALAVPEKAPRKTRPPRRTQEQRRREAEHKMLKAAFEIIAERGLEELTLQEAGERAGYSRALPAHYFDSKDDLIARLADFVVDGYIRRLYRAGPPQPGLEAFLKRMAFNLEENIHHRNGLRAFHIILAAGVARPELAARQAKFDRQSVERIASLLRACRERGEIRKDIDIPSTAIIILGSLRGVMSQWVVSPRNVPIERVTKTFVDNLRRILTA